jgi:Ca-activated chloride channel family protein
MPDHAKASFKKLKTASLAALAAFALSTVPSWAGQLGARVSLDRPVVLQGQNQVVYVLVNIDAMDEEIPSANRPPLNISLVLDRSGSMADAGKMDYLKRAAKMAIDRLNQRDTLSIVEYDDAITVMVSPTRVADSRRFHRLIDELEPRGSTNLAGGLDQGVDEALEARNELARDSGTISRVILMSDGLANAGVTDPNQIRGMVRAAKNKGVRISSMGLGRDYDEDLMQDLAENGGGRYYYIEHPTQMARVFEEELATMFRTTAKDCEFTFDGSSAVRKAEIVGFDAQAAQDLKQPLEDFYAGEKRSVLLRLEVAAGQTGNLDLGALKVSYKGAKDQTAQVFSAPVQVSVTADRQAADRAVNKPVAVEAALAETERAQKEQVKLFEAGRAEEAARNMAAMKKDLEGRNATLNDDKLRRKIEGLSVESRQMTAAASAPAEQKEAFAKATKNRLYQAKQGNRALQNLQLGDKGIAVERLQEALKKQGFYSGPIDGKYDADVKLAVEKMQKAKNMNADGVAGAEAMDALAIY